MAGRVVNMQRLPLGQRYVCLQGDNHAFRRFRRSIGQQPVSAVQLLFFRIPGNVQRDTLSGVGTVSGLVLCVQSAHAHRFIHARQPEGISHADFTAQRGAGYDQPRTFYGKGPVDRQTKAVMAGVSA